MMKEATMHEPGIGERAEAARARRSKRVVYASVVVAAVLMGGTALFKAGPSAIAPAWAIAVAVIYVVTMLASAWIGLRRSDEVEAGRSVQAIAAGGAIYWLLYPAWYFLWRGGLTIEPDAEAICLTVFATTMLAYLWMHRR